MSKYLTSGKSTRYTRSDQLNGSAYARATQLNRDKNNSSDATESADEIQQYVSLAAVVKEPTTESGQVVNSPIRTTLASCNSSTN